MPQKEVRGWLKNFILEIYYFLTWYYYPPELAFLKEYILRNTRQHQMYKVIFQQFGAVVWPLYLGFRDYSSGLKSMYLSGLLEVNDRNPILTCLNTSGDYGNVQWGVLTNRKQGSGNWGAAVSLNLTSCFWESLPARLFHTVEDMTDDSSGITI